METVTTLPRGREFTLADLDAMPDDGNRYELIDGALIVTPGPSLPHQSVVGELHLVLRAAVPADQRVFLAPTDVELGGGRTRVQPDLLVTTAEQASGLTHRGVPLMAVEVLSPSTLHIDLGLKRSRYEAAGCPSYWVVDPSVPSVTAWDLVDGHYVEAGTALGDEVLSLRRPFAVTLSPARLVG